MVEVAHRFVSEGALRVRHARPFPDPGDDQEDLRSRWVTTDGLGPVFWGYLCILLGHSDVMTDVMIARYLPRELTLDREPTAKEGRAIGMEAAGALKMSYMAIDHAIWSYERNLGGPQGYPGQIDSLVHPAGGFSPRAEFARFR